MARLLCISDLHVANARNRAFVEEVEPHPNDWLVVAGDVGESVAQVEWALGLLGGRFRQVVWTPGNHELWTLPNDPTGLRGEERYRHLVDCCRRLGVLTPEDPYPVVEVDGREVVVAPLFCLYDYSFHPDGAGHQRHLLRQQLARRRAGTGPLGGHDAVRHESRDHGRAAAGSTSRGTRGESARPPHCCG